MKDHSQNKELQNIVDEHFSYLFEREVLDEISDVGVYKKVISGDILIEVGSRIENMPLLINGALKVFIEKTDHEQILYYIERGDTCAMTLNCCVGKTKSEIKAVAEVDSELILVPVDRMEGWLRFKSWRKFVFESYNNRLFEMLDAIDSLAFLRLDERVVKHLKDKVLINHTTFLTISHLDIAIELNTSRVVISRVLKKLEIEGEIKLHRGRIEVLNF